MQHRAGLAALGVNVAVHAPFAGRQQRVVAMTVETDVDDVGRLQFCVGQARRGNQETLLETRADIARAALVDACGIHRHAGFDDLAGKRFAI